MTDDGALSGMFLVLALISYYFYPVDEIAMYAGLFFLAFALFFFFRWKHPTNKKLLAEEDK